MGVISTAGDAISGRNPLDFADGVSLTNKVKAVPKSKGMNPVLARATRAKRIGLQSTLKSKKALGATISKVGKVGAIGAAVVGAGVLAHHLIARHQAAKNRLELSNESDLCGVQY